VPRPSRRFPRIESPDADGIEDEAIAIEGASASLTTNRERFAKGGESGDAKRQKAAVAATWKRLDAVEEGGAPDDSPVASLSAAVTEMQAFSGAARHQATEVGKVCASKAGKLDEAYVRLFLAGGEGAPKDVVVLEPAASPALKKCVVDALRKATLPKAPEMIGPRYVVSVPLKK
jgi:hypothetical protein